MRVVADPLDDEHFLFHHGETVYMSSGTEYADK